MSWYWTGRLPLEDRRDVLARVGFRFLWVTVPYFGMAWFFGLDPFGPPRPLLGLSATFLVISIPLIGGLIDWCRVQSRRA